MFLIVSACSTDSESGNDYIFSQDDELISMEGEIQILDSGAVLSNFINKYHLDNKTIYLRGKQSKEVSRYSLVDSTYFGYSYNEKPIEINDFSVGTSQLFLMSGYSKTILVFDKNDGAFLNEIFLDVQNYDIEYRMGESLFHYNEKDRLFYIGLKENLNANGIELVGAFDFSGQLQFTFGDFTEDNDEAKPGYLLSNDGIRSQLTKKALYVLKKETSRLYQFDLKGNLSEFEVLDFIKIPEKEKVNKEGRSIIKDQVMDFRVDESNQEMVYTYITNTGEYMGEKSPDTYLAYKKLKSDTITYNKVEFLKLIDFKDDAISTIPINKNSDHKFFTRFNINGN